MEQHDQGVGSWIALSNQVNAVICNLDKLRFPVPTKSRSLFVGEGSRGLYGNRKGSNENHRCNDAEDYLGASFHVRSQPQKPKDSLLSATGYGCSLSWVSI